MTFCSRRRARPLLWLASVFLTVALHGLGPAQDRPAEPSAQAIALNSAGVGYMNQYLFKEASIAFRKALASQPGFALARLNLGLAQLYDQELDGAAATLEEAVAAEPSNPWAHYALGLVYKNKGEGDKAVLHLRHVTEIDPGDPDAYYNLGIVFVRQRNVAEAERALRRVLELQPMNTSAMYNLGTLLMKDGRVGEGQPMLERFRALQQGGPGSEGGMGVGSQYGEMGVYATARDYVPALRGPREAKGPAAGAAFIDASAAAGLSAYAQPRGPQASGPFPTTDWNEAFIRTRLLPALGGGVALADLDSDGDVDVLATRFAAAAGRWETLVLTNDGKGRFSDGTAASGIANSGGQVSAAVGDYDNDGLADVYLAGVGGNGLFRNTGKGVFEDVTGKSGTGDSGVCASATFVDYDHDGDLDLYVSHYLDPARRPSGASFDFPGNLPGAPNRMFRNNGDGTFTDRTDALGVGAGTGRHLGAIATDIDNDRDVDLLVIREAAPPVLLSNGRNDRFDDVSVSSGLQVPGSAPAMAVADLTRDGAMDVLLGPDSPGTIRLAVNRGNGTFTPGRREVAPGTPSPGGRSGACALDFDGDGDLDLCVLAPDGGRILENTGGGGFVSAAPIPAGSGTAAAVADLDGDSRPDILCLDEGGSPRLLANRLATPNRWVGVQLEGLRSNKPGFGAKVEVRAGDGYQKFEISGHGGFLSQDGPVLWAGLGASDRADTVTVRWPGGILQSEVGVTGGRVARIRELDRKGTSCPLLYSWNGRGFEFVTDFLGGSAYGYLVAPGRYSTPDTDEYVRIEGRQLAPRNGRYEVRLNNQLEEVILFDRVRLLVVDHPGGTEIYPDERLMPAPPFPDFRIHTARGARTPVSAVDDDGRDVIAGISTLDRTCPDGFELLPFKGYARQHSLTLDLGPFADSNKVLLLMDGWIDYADSSSNLAASQSGLALVPPFLQVRNAEGAWETALPSMGFPAGLPKTMTVDLTGRFPTRDHHVRIVTNMRIYWDRIRVDTSEDAPLRVTRLEPLAADLQFRGYPTYYTPDGRKPWIYDYARILPAERWGTHAGAYTRFGDVRALLQAADDMYVITRHGDEIAVEFDAAGVPPPPPGWSRDFLLYADGFGKDMDLNSLHADEIGPLPFHGMSRYPYPPAEHYPRSPAHLDYLRKYNTRVYPDEAAAAITVAGRR